MLVWIKLLSNWIFLNQTMLVENLQQLGLCELQALVQICQTLGLAQLLFGHRTDGFIEHVGHVKEVLAETLNTEYFGISHLFVHSVSQILKVSQTSPILVHEVVILLSQCGNLFLEGLLRLGHLLSRLFLLLLGILGWFWFFAPEQCSSVLFSVNCGRREFKELLSIRGQVVTFELTNWRRYTINFLQAACR